MSDVEDQLRDWAAQPGPRRVLDALRRRLVNGGGTDRPLSFVGRPLTEDERSQLVELFGNNGAVTRERIHLGLAQASLNSSRAAMSLQDLVTTVYGPIVTNTERKRERTLLNTRRVAAERDDLLAVMRPVPQLNAEYHLLMALPIGSTSQVPERSATLAQRWSSYAAAVRAAAVWWPRYIDGTPTTEKGLAATAFGGSKLWTDAGRAAFQNLVGLPFDQAVEKADTEVRLRGPLRWTLDDVVVDAHLADPWVSVPARGALHLGDLQGDPDGVLLVENLASFTQVCGLADVVDSWLCVWTKGFAANGLIEFVRQFPTRPLAAWCDLDPSGIEIIQDIERRTGREVHPVGMDPEYWTAATKRNDSSEDRAKWQERAAALAQTGPPRLRQLAARMAATGARVEQETLEVTDEVILALADRLHDIYKRQT